MKDLARLAWFLRQDTDSFVAWKAAAALLDHAVLDAAHRGYDLWVARDTVERSHVYSALCAADIELARALARHPARVRSRVVEAVFDGLTCGEIQPSWLSQLAEHRAVTTEGAWGKRNVDAVVALIAADTRKLGRQLVRILQMTTKQQDVGAAPFVSTCGIVLHRLAQIRGLEIDIEAPNLPRPLLEIPWGDKRDWPERVLGLKIEFPQLAATGAGRR